MLNPTDEEILAAYREWDESPTCDEVDFMKAPDCWFPMFRHGYLAGHAKRGKVVVRWVHGGCGTYAAFVGEARVLVIYANRQRWVINGPLSKNVPFQPKETTIDAAKAALTTAIESWFESCLGGEG